MYCQICRDWNVQIYNFLCYLLWVWHLICHADGKAWTLDVQEYVAEQNISVCGDELIGDGGGIAYCGVLWFVLFTKYYSDDQIKNSEMGGACDMGERGEVYTAFWWGNRKEKAHL
jgi:hypothetical protein